MNKFACIDIGNTNAKLGLFQDDTLIEQYSRLSDTDLLNLLKSYKFDFVGVANVGQSREELLKELEKFTKIYKITGKTSLPFPNLYATPETLGADRIAGVAAAHWLNPHSASLVIDAGTCITYDFITEKGEYLGGAIAPGLQMRFKALAHFTAKLPFVGLPEQNQLVGNSTLTSIQSGVCNGMLGEIEGFINRFERNLGKFKTFICGGDAIFFETMLKDKIFVEPNLILIGIHRILKYNVQNNQLFH